MKILILSFYYSPDLCAGSFRTTAFVKALKAEISANDTIEVITTFPNRYKTFRMETECLEVEGNVTIRRIKVPAHSSGFYDQIWSFLVYFVNVLKVVRQKKYDLVFATSSRLFSAFLGAVISKWKGIPLYLDIRDIFTDTLRSVLKKSRLKYAVPFFLLFEKFTMRCAGKINLVSKGFAPYFQKKYNKDYSFFTNGIDDDFIGFDRDSTPHLRNGNVIFTYTGNVGEGQGLEKIVPQIAQKYKNIDFIIIGDGGRINSLIKSTSHMTNVKIMKPVSRNELITYYQKSDILFLHLNDYDAFKKVLPSKIFEYAAMYKPIIAGVDGYAKEFLEQHLPDSLIFRPCDLNDFSEKYDKFTGNINREQRNIFISRFSRQNIMNAMAKDFLGSHVKSIECNKAE